MALQKRPVKTCHCATTTAFKTVADARPKDQTLNCKLQAFARSACSRSLSLQTVFVQEAELKAGLCQDIPLVITERVPLHRKAACVSTPSCHAACHCGMQQSSLFSEVLSICSPCTYRNRCPDLDIRPSQQAPIHSLNTTSFVTPSCCQA